MEFVKIFKNIVKTWDRNKIIKSIYILLDKLDISEEQKDVYKNAIEILDDTKLKSLENKLIITLEQVQEKILDYRSSKDKLKFQKISKNLNWIRRKEIIEKEKDELTLWLLTSNL